MLLLFETAAGYALFKVLKEDKLEEVDVSASWARRPPCSLSCALSCLTRFFHVCTLPQDLFESFSSLDRAQKVRVGDMHKLIMLGG